MALAGDLIGAVGIGVDREQSAGFVDDQAQAGVPVQRSHHDPIGDPAAIVDCRQPIYQA